MGGSKGRGALPSPHSPAPAASFPHCFPPFSLSPPSRCGRSGSAKGGIDHMGESLPSSCPLGVYPRLCSLPFIFPPRFFLLEGVLSCVGAASPQNKPAVPVRDSAGPLGFSCPCCWSVRAFSSSRGLREAEPTPLGNGCASYAARDCSPSLSRGGRLWGGFPLDNAAVAVCVNASSPPPSRC